AIALWIRFGQSGQHGDLEEAISFHREALELRPAPHPGRSSSLDNIAIALSTRFEHFGRHEDLEEAISFHREALALLPATHLDRPASLNNVAIALSTLFEESGRHEDLEEAISLLREALELLPAPHPGRSAYLNNIATALTTRFEQSGRHEDLEESISLHREALELRPAPHPLRSSSLSNIAIALRTRFEQSSGQGDLEEAISLHREALELRPDPHPDRSASLNNIATALSTRFEESGRHEDLEEAISFLREALKLRPTPYPGQSACLHTIATALWTRFEQSGRHEDLEEAISFHREALELLPAPHPDRPASLSTIATALLTRVGQSGQHEDLEEAIAFHREALELRPAPHPGRSVSLNSIAVALWTRFEQFGQHRDLDEAISFHREALEMRPAPHFARSTSLDNIAIALQTRFEQFGQYEDLEEAISLNRKALELLPASHPGRSACLNNIATTLQTRFDQSGQHEDLEGAISFNREALELRPVPHPDRSSSLNNIATVLSTRFDQSGRHEDLEEAISFLREALELRPTAPASQRFHTARAWASHADSRHDSALDAYQAAIELLPRLAMLSFDLSSRQQALTYGSDGLARAAAACAIESGQFERAVELLEEGRAVFWSQALQLRTPTTDLRKVAPGLEESLRDISLALEQGSLRDVSWDMSDNSQQRMSMEREAVRLRRLNDKWLATLEEVRQLKGFEDFLRPRRISTLLGAAADGPVVILNASKAGCAALILTLLNGVQHMPLELTFADVTALLTRQSLESRDMTRVQSNHQYNDFQMVLAVLWQSVVRRVFHSLGLEKSDTLPNLWWCPTGPFTFLPIHAAGMYNTGEPQCVPDYVVSSYTPTISALLSNVPVSDSFKMMVVIEPNTPGQSGLPYTIDELQRIESHVPEKDLIKFNSANVEEVVLHLPTTSIAHFACHGQQHPENPLESALMLHDGPLKVFQIMQQLTPNARLAFLGACQTAMGDKTLPDEVIHLASTLLFAGFQGVVATMWSISDEDGPKVADAFYEYLYRKKPSAVGPDTRESARALHVAVAMLRSEGVSFKRWVPFIHMGR
ncbi:CHAT domain-containing protein, partial [Gautieria morchelliformis]